jgi:hypothetical protein
MDTSFFSSFDFCKNLERGRGREGGEREKTN